MFYQKTKRISFLEFLFGSGNYPNLVLLFSYRIPGTRKRDRLPNSSVYELRETMAIN